MRGIRYANAASRNGFELWKGFIDNDRHRNIQSRVQDVSGSVEEKPMVASLRQAPSEAHYFNRKSGPEPSTWQQGMRQARAVR